jgi:hypothetical protein
MSQHLVLTMVRFDERKAGLIDNAHHEVIRTFYKKD